MPKRKGRQSGGRKLTQSQALGVAVQMYKIQSAHRQVRDMRSYLHSILMNNPKEYEDELEKRARNLGVPKEILDIRLPLSESEKHFRKHL
jgi:hypothetical protein